MSEWGLSTHGFKPKTFAAIQQELQDELKAHVCSQLQFSSNTIAGQLVGIFSAHLRELWELANSVYASLDPDAASGRALTALASLTGTIRRQARTSSVQATVKLAPRTTLPSGCVASVAGDTSIRFVTQEHIANKTDDIRDFAVDCVAENYGPISAPAHTLTVIATPVAGWLEVTNANDALLGCFEETDTELRLRRVKELRAPGSGTLDALTAKLEMLPQVRGVLILHNDGSSTNTVPAHAIEAIVLGGNDNDIAQTIWQHKALGIDTHGSTAVLVKDSQGHEHKINFSRPEHVFIHLKITLKCSTRLSIDDQAKLKKNIVDYTKTHIGLGVSVFASRLYGPIFAHQHILDITELLMYQQHPEQAFDGTVAPHQYAEFLVERIDIHEC